MLQMVSHSETVFNRETWRVYGAALATLQFAELVSQFGLILTTDQTLVPHDTPSPVFQTSHVVTADFQEM